MCELTTDNKDLFEKQKLFVMYFAELVEKRLKGKFVELPTVNNYPCDKFCPEECFVRMIKTFNVLAAHLNPSRLIRCETAIKYKGKIYQLGINLNYDEYLSYSKVIKAAEELAMVINAIGKRKSK